MEGSCDAVGYELVMSKREKTFVKLQSMRARLPLNIVKEEIWKEG